ncbi:UDP-N-acetylmuramoyl-L-alanine--D-glutamate ligase [Acetobacter orleanensis]|uniref:UDP-N-acetylmuramoylalanine--D-glutamate ligase n=1 Tax=Acetobacter orleanensis TaxID=104099 RepID=A0A4Y3TMA6_9PROT|nr:UDP-N-acetylmuramoyl-L-alanine--D-glutamate ligase [Acetobacter orleanensis]KXV63553.1 UDP-N-acetylmuramoyl-L-alanyl-D-glutamate synthetase [Acetobacter orleanensis]PCD79882.1 UDP-N-acetylmuramoyl-L-alanine--D-glutamate ligase [Acetobacter orleanensis]GAN68179.1 UDP-N-acetylmuramoyl-L-alanyl-D-glutamate synthetase [Acetobacter orleanensis JCM 7639]GBR31501.1 UDP-N-acetylmuramoyl-L-alanyl-D-glutamate synthetase [Acetobacter orleanensis NRIC 0473]GEB82928.1 UDP-N-acetylmuramoylalanine--D-glut
MSAFPPTLFTGQHFAVLGLGRNGLPAVCALAQSGATVQAWDDGEAARAALAKAITGLPQDAAARITCAPIESLAGADGLVLSPGIPHVLPKPHPVALMAQEAGVPILSDAELLYRAVRKSGSKARFAGITGTNGKSTTTTLLAHILAEAGVPVAAGGNLGPAALALPLLPDNGVYVLEMSSYMLERLDTLRFDAACLLNLTPDHLDRHAGMDGYARAKTRVFTGQTAQDLAVIGVDDDYCRAIARTLKSGPAQCLTISGTNPDSDLYGQDNAIWRAGERLARLGPALPGSHNAENAAAACAMARFLGVSDAQLAAALLSFPGLPHRQKLVAEQNGVAFIDDSKATNADAAARALGCYDRLIWIAGGMAKEGGIASLTPYFPRIVHAFLIGRDAAQLAETLAAHGVPSTLSGTLEAAVPAAYAAARSTDTPVVLLSPACASFDQFSGFEARGVRFLECVRAVTDQPQTGTGKAD